MNHGKDCEQVSSQQVIDFIRRKRNNIGQELFSVIKKFQEKSESDSKFFFANEIDHAGTLRSIFWTDGKVISFYLSFSDVVVFDTT